MSFWVVLSSSPSGLSWKVIVQPFTETREQSKDREVQEKAKGAKKKADLGKSSEADSVFISFHKEN